MDRERSPKLTQIRLVRIFRLAFNNVGKDIFVYQSSCYRLSFKVLYLKYYVFLFIHSDRKYMKNIYTMSVTDFTKYL